MSTSADAPRVFDGALLFLNTARVPFLIRQHGPTTAQSQRNPADNTHRNNQTQNICRNQKKVLDPQKGKSYNTTECTNAPP